MNRDDTHDTVSLPQEAAGWWLRLNATPDDEALRQDAMTWRNQSEAHERAFALVGEMWQMADEIGPAISEPVTDGIVVPFHRKTGARLRKSPLKWFGGIAAGIAACLAVVSAPEMSVRWQSDYLTPAGELQTVKLPDGSLIVLDTNSAIALDFEGAQRGVKLLRGRVWFDVTKDAARPFIVTADEVRIEVLGTAFDVDMRDDGVEINLREGRVRAVSSTSGTHILSAGDVLHTGSREGSDRVARLAPESMGLWREKRLLIEDMPLEAALSELKRYHSGLVHIDGQALKQARVTGVYNVRDPERALAAMIEPHGASVRSYGPWVKVIHKNSN